jgi:hypothetical protein
MDVFYIVHLLIVFLFVWAQIEAMDALFEAQFSTLVDSGRILSKCGKCLRYMKYISAQPPRLYCGTCEEVYDLPQKGIIKVVSYNLFNSIKIWFQLILSFPLCFFLSYMIF